ncbi:winged helix-turn-helix domain-containing protein [Prevotella pallens]|uniref:winged helix-turn-helix domain-containing protein n=1 Tax=Prevotella pallens TaxID=60133 RepID=UPI001CB4B950|nr:helix-turn-helix domain-containing protein [Prevotella pallens]MBF1462646.1 helix-turn-helix domain-containing protein [Prevotella pallens]
MKPYTAVIVFLTLVLSSVFTSINSYNHTKKMIVNDMNRALALTLSEQQEAWITPDTIINYRKNLKIDVLRNESFVTYALNNTPKTLCSKPMKWVRNNNRNIILQSYATCSLFTIYGLSNQRSAAFLLFLSLVWLVSSVYWLRKHRLGTLVLNSLIYSNNRQMFYNIKQMPVPFTPMQQQLMQLFVASADYKLSKQTICDALWPKKPDATETLYTLIRRIKPVLKKYAGLNIVTERGGDYRLEKQ